MCSLLAKDHGSFLQSTCPDSSRKPNVSALVTFKHNKLLHGLLSDDTRLSALSSPVFHTDEANHPNSARSFSGEGAHVPKGGWIGS